jgi:Na+-transporting NADH:ubiquinone oxidoreductase subunit NqrB
VVGRVVWRVGRVVGMVVGLVYHSVWQHVGFSAVLLTGCLFPVGLPIMLVLKSLE